MRLARGRHRIVARLGGAGHVDSRHASDGTPLGVASSDDPRGTYGSRLRRSSTMPTCSIASSKTARRVAVDDDMSRYLGSYLAHSEEEDDVAAVIIEPLVSEPALATPASLAMAATIAEKDPIFPESDRHDLARDLRRARRRQRSRALVAEVLARARQRRQEGALRFGRGNPQAGRSLSRCARHSRRARRSSTAGSTGLPSAR